MITNEDVIRVNQHTTDNKEIYFENGISIWTAKDKENGKTYMAVMNISETTEKVVLPLEKAGISSNANIRDLWIKTDIASSTAPEVELAPHGARLFSLQ